MKSKNVLSGFTFLSFFLWVTGPCVSAEPEGLTLELYRDHTTNPPLSNSLDTHLGGVGEGFAVANEMMKFRGQQPLFCPPEKLGLVPSQLRDILEREVKRTPPRGNPWRDKDFVSLILIYGLMDTFPCPK